MAASGLVGWLLLECIGLDWRRGGRTFAAEELHEYGDGGFGIGE